MHQLWVYNSHTFYTAETCIQLSLHLKKCCAQFKMPDLFFLFINICFVLPNPACQPRAGVLLLLGTRTMYPWVTDR